MNLKKSGLQLPALSFPENIYLLPDPGLENKKMTISLASLHECIEKHSKPEKSKLIENIATIIVNEAPDEFTGGFTVAQLCTVAESILETLQAATEKFPHLKVFNPSRKTDKWASDFTVLEVCLPDRPFLLDSIKVGLKRIGIGVHSYVHPVFDLSLDKDGKVNEVFSHQGRNSGLSFSYELFLLNKITDPKLLKEIVKKINRILVDVVRATDDYEAMRKKCRGIAKWIRALPHLLPDEKLPESEDKLDEYAQFLDWLDDDNFVFLGYRDYLFLRNNGITSVKVNSGSGLGILVDEKASKYFSPIPISKLPAEQQERLESKPVLQVTKTNAESNVHRPPRMDYIGIKKYDQQGRVTGEERFQGLFTLKAFSTSSEKIPLLRVKLQDVLHLDRARPQSHDFKQIINMFNSIPRTDLFWLNPVELHKDIRKIMEVQQDHDVQVMFRSDPLHRGYAVMVLMPRDRFNSEVRQRIHEYLEKQLKASRVIYQLALIGDEEANFRIHFFLTSKVPYGKINIETISREINRLTLNWDDYLRESLSSELGPEGSRLSSKYSPLLPDGYKAEISLHQAVRDIQNLEKLSDVSPVLEMANPHVIKDPAASTHLTIYHRGSTIPLSRVFPILKNLGLEVLEQISYQIPTPNQPSTIDIFRVLGPSGRIVNLKKDGLRLQEAILDVLNEKIGSDRLNTLVLTASLSARQVFLLQAFRGHIFQLKPTTSQSFITSTLLDYTDCCHALVECFETRFNPAEKKKRKEKIKAADKAFLAALDKVTSLPQDELLRFLHTLIMETKRTNFYLDRNYLSFKVASRNLSGIPEPKPFWETFVSSPDVEAVHLRGGRIARGGLRWSDRPDDFRTEILGLVKTQITKNALIVPTGSKGGFVVKRPPQDQSQLRTYVENQYKTLIRGLLDLTDNIIDGETVHPAGLIIYDDPDPYLVVAADKGTATFSDLANSISREYDFWLGDAFASGGSHGYDHKKEGITAKGAWECVARHFREMGLDVHRDEFTVAGIGDMAGDVFGNGMVYSEKIRLLAAFNHRHIFLDPDPDAAAGFEERLRLFRDPSLTWNDYDRKLISKGGGVFERDSKSLPLSPRAQAMLGTDKSELSGLEIIRSILKMEVDLLWNGGIGTYIKASAEHDSDVGDSANNAVRINAPELRARIIGEGGNLGLTQKARIEYSLAGGKINTDALDNSGGVDMSDHEVNIKILLQPMLQQGELGFEERNEFLSRMTDSVSRLVLRNNFTQSLCLTLAEKQGIAGLETLKSLMQYLSTEGDLNPKVEFLPTGKELAARKSNRQGMSRPELAILLGYTKIRLKKSILNSDIPKTDIFQHCLYDYFPRELSKKFSGSLTSHPLKNEIITTQLTNLSVDCLGLNFFHRLIKDTRAHPIEAIRSVLAVIEILDLPELWSNVFALDNSVSVDMQYRMMEEISEAVRAVSHWVLLSDCDTRNLDAFFSKYKPGSEKIRGEVPEYLHVERLQKQFNKFVAASVDAGLTEKLSRDLATLPYLPSFMGIIDVVSSTGMDMRDVAGHFYATGEILWMGWFREELSRVQSRQEWDSVALVGLIMDLRNLQRNLTLQYITDNRFPEISLEDFLRTNPRDLDRYLQVLQKMRVDDEEVEISGASVAVRMLHQLSSNIKE